MRRGRLFFTLVSVFVIRFARAKLMRLLFPIFPRGRAGVGLMLLRVVVAAAAVDHGVSSFVTCGESLWAAALASRFALLGGLLLFVGFLTPVAAVYSAFYMAAVGLQMISSGGPGEFTTATCGGVTIVLAASVLLAGPGSYSVDSYFFGPREIVIPANSRSSH